MSITWSKLIYNVKALIRERNDDTKLTNSQLSHLINNARATLIRRDYENKHTINPQIEQSLGIWDLILIDKSACPVKVPTGCNVLRTKNPLPKFVEVYNKNLLTYVGSVDQVDDFQLIPASRMRWIRFGKYTKDKPFAAIIGDYLYVIDIKTIGAVALRGVLDDPLDASQYTDIDCRKCFDPDGPYPIAAWMEKAIFDLLKGSELAVYLAVQSDKTNDADDSTEPNTKKN